MSALIDWNNALQTCAAVLVLKNAVLVLITLRHRLIFSKFNFDEERTNLFAKIATPLLLAYPRFGGGKPEDIEVSERACKNAAENEPMFMVLAITASSVGASANVIYLFMWFRILHALSFLLMPFTRVEPRTLFYSLGLGVALYLAIYALI